MAEPHPGWQIACACWCCGEDTKVWRGVFNFICTHCGALNWMRNRGETKGTYDASK